MKYKFFDVIESELKIIFMINKGSMESKNEGQFHFLEHLLASHVINKTNKNYNHINCFENLDGKTDNHFLYITVNNFKSENEIINYLLSFIDFINLEEFDKKIYINEKKMVLNENKNKLNKYSYNLYLLIINLLYGKNGTNGDEDSLLNDNEMINLKRNLINNDYCIIFINLYEETKNKLKLIIDDYNNNFNNDNLLTSYNIKYNFNNNSKIINYYYYSITYYYILILFNVNEFLIDYISLYECDNIYIISNSIVITMDIDKKLNDDDNLIIKNLINNLLLFLYKTIINNNNYNLINKLYLLSYKYENQSICSIENYLIDKINNSNIMLNKFFLFKPSLNILKNKKYNIYYEINKIIDEDLNFNIKINKKIDINNNKINDKNNNIFNLILINKDLLIIKDKDNKNDENILDYIDNIKYYYNIKNNIEVNFFLYLSSLNFFEKNTFLIGSKSLVSSNNILIDFKKNNEIKKDFILYNKNINDFFNNINELIPLINNVDNPITPQDENYFYNLKKIIFDYKNIYFINNFNNVNLDLNNNNEFSKIFLESNNNKKDTLLLKDKNKIEIIDYHNLIYFINIINNNKILNDENDFFYYYSKENNIVYYSFIDLYIIPLVLYLLVKQRILYTFNYNIVYGFNFIIFKLNNKLNINKEFINTYKTLKLKDKYKSYNSLNLLNSIINNMMSNNIENFNYIKVKLDLNIDEKKLDEIIFNMFK